MQGKYSGWLLETAERPELSQVRRRRAFLCSKEPSALPRYDFLARQQYAAEAMVEFCAIGRS